MVCQLYGAQNGCGYKVEAVEHRTGGANSALAQEIAEKHSGKDDIYRNDTKNQN